MTDIIVPKSKRLYVRGINKLTNKESIHSHFQTCGEVSNIDFDDNNRRGYCWVEYADQVCADNAIVQLHQTQLNGTCLDIRYDNRFKKVNHSIAKSIKEQNNTGCKLCKRKADEICTSSTSSGSKVDSTIGYYSSDSLIVGDKEYPIPQGRYLIKLLRLCHSSVRSEVTAHLLDILTESRHGNKHNKEVTESMAMVDAVHRVGHLTCTDWSTTPNVNVYVVADGKTPYTTAALALFLPRTWHFASIDPILDFDAQQLGEFSSRCHMVPRMSQDYVIEDYCETSADRSRLVGSVTANTEGNNASDDNRLTTSAASSSQADAMPSFQPTVNIVIACHSHAPLQEFWDRVACPKYAVVMPCCGKEWSKLSCAPIDTYDDYEVYSPKRKIFLYHEK